ncbi:MAG: hypothetical protein E7293_00355 [Lachnospiraceae bacterium]|nr:hypothetical protein [Lachnospiraceae bacterium]
MENGTKERKFHIDLLRILACFGVIMAHTASQYWYDLPVESFQWMVSNSYNAVFRFCVPVFIMISGALFLGRAGEIDIKRLYQNNILHLVAAYWIWSLLYGLWDGRAWIGADGVGLLDWVREIVYSRGHLWFIPMLVGIYAILPVLKGWTDHAPKKQIEYFLVLFLVLNIGIFTLRIWNLPMTVNKFLDFFDVPLVGSYVGYFVLGYYLSKYSLPPSKRKLCYLLGLAGAAVAAVVSNVLSLQRGWGVVAAYDVYSVFTMLVCVALFVFFQEKVSQKAWGERSRRWIKEVSANTFGIYVLHFLIIELLQLLGFDSMSVNNVVGIPLLAVVCFVISSVIISLLRRIPLVGKYIC